MMDSVMGVYMANKLLSNRENVVIPGFYGANEEGDIITFSRGGSDITGSIISSGINANLYENWTDVSGFLMADPRIVKAPKTIETISYKELRELSYICRCPAEKKKKERKSCLRPFSFFLI